MTGSRPFLQRARLALPFTARFSKGPLRRGQPCMVTQYTLFKAREGCDLCHRPQQAERQVLIDLDGRTIRAGLNCLEEVSGITPRAMEQAVQGHLGVALRLRNLSVEGFDDEQAMLDQIRRVVDQVGQNMELAGIRRELQRLRQGDSFQSSDLRWLEQVVDHLAVVDGARRDPERHARLVQAVWGHPGPRAKDARVQLDRARFEEPQTLSLTQTRELRRVLNELRTVPPRALWSETVVPWDYATPEGYHAALAAHFKNLADAGAVKPDHLQRQYDLVHFERGPARMADVTTNLGVPCVLPIYQHDTIRGLKLTGAGARRSLEMGNRLPRLALDEQSVTSRRTHTALVRTDHPDRRWNNRGGQRPALPEDLAEVSYRCVAYWRPDSWQPVYALWLEHGRENLLTFPVLGRS